MGIAIEVRQGSVTDADVDVLVNASNTLGQLGSGVSAAIREACGPGFQKVIDDALATRGGSLEPGDVVLTGAGTHGRTRHVAHVAVMDYRPGAARRAPDEDRIHRASVELWRALEGLPSPSSIGMVALGAGTGGLGERMPTRVACRTLLDHLEELSSSGTSSKIARVVFHGFLLHEYVNVLDEVARVWPHVLDSVPSEVRDHVRAFRAITS
jgi:O-acetyl-ADP-ribose deacetylase (regulator of RNase III)